MDINYILNGKRKQQKGTPKRDGSGMGIRSNWNRGKCYEEPKGPILGDRVTKPQRRAMKIAPFADWDGDGVINGLDCQPRNRKRHAYTEEDEEKLFIMHEFEDYHGRPPKNYHEANKWFEEMSGR